MNLSASDTLTTSTVCWTGPERRNPGKPNAKVLHLINGEHFSGAERVQQLLGKHLNGLGYDALFACLKPKNFPQQAAIRSYQITEFPMRGKLDLSVVRGVKALAAETQACLLHAHTPRTALVTSIAARQLSLPWVYHVHSPTARDSTRRFSNILNAMTENFAIRNCDRLITVSRSLRRDLLRRGIAPRKIAHVANGVPELTPLQPTERSQSTNWKLGMIALMRPRKGLEVLLQAMAQLPDTAQRIQLELIGSFETPEYEAKIQGMLDSLGLRPKVSVRGFVADIPSALHDLDVLLLPSLFGEGLPMVVLEALSAGVPVIASRVEGTPEAVRHGIEGYLAQPNDATSLAECIQELTNSRTRWAQFSQQAVLRHRSRFTSRRMAEGVAKVYRQLDIPRD